MSADSQVLFATPADAQPVASFVSCDERWFAAYTCANHEKRVSAHLVCRNIKHFLPLYSSVRRWKDRKVRLDLPLFPGYVFVQVNPLARLAVLGAPGVVHLVGFHGQPYPIPDREIENLKTAMMTGLRFEPYPMLTVGCRVRVKRGPLAGSEGILVRKKNLYRVVLTIDVIARSAAVEVDVTDLEKLQ